MKAEFVGAEIRRSYRDLVNQDFNKICATGTWYNLIVPTYAATMGLLSTQSDELLRDLEGS